MNAEQTLALYLLICSTAALVMLLELCWRCACISAARNHWLGD